MLEGNTAEGPTLDKHSQRTEWAEPSRRMKEPQWLELFVYLYFFFLLCINVRNSSRESA